jgi:hypothetical protein
LLKQPDKQKLATLLRPHFAVWKPGHLSGLDGGFERFESVSDFLNLTGCMLKDDAS